MLKRLLRELYPVLLVSFIGYPKDANYTEPIASLLHLLGKKEDIMDNSNDVGQRHIPNTKGNTNTDTQDETDDTTATVAAVVALQGATEAMQGVWENLLFDKREKRLTRRRGR